MTNGISVNAEIRIFTPVQSTNLHVLRLSGFEPLLNGQNHPNTPDKLGCIREKPLSNTSSRSFQNSPRSHGCESQRRPETGSLKHSSKACVSDYHRYSQQRLRTH